MNKKLMRFAAALLAAAMLFSFSACRTNDDGSESSTDEPSVTDAGNIHEESTDSAELTTAEPTTESRTATRSNVSGGTKTETVNVYKGLNSTNTSRVLQYYKAAAANTKSIDATQYMSMKRVDYTPRNSFQKGMLTVFTGIASAALAANSKAVTIIPGKYKQIKASDLISANAVAYGNYTIVTLNVRMQQDDQNTKDAHQGPVGRTVGTVGNLDDRVFEAMPSVKVDCSKGSITLKYDDCKVVVKIDNGGSIVSGTWSYTVDVDIDNIYASIAGSEELLITNTGGAVEFVIKTNDEISLQSRNSK